MATAIAPPVETLPKAPPSPKRRGLRWRDGLLVASSALLAGEIIATGSNRTPADPTQPLSFAGPAEQIARPTLRIGTFNIHSAEGLDGATDLGRVAEVLRASGAEIVALNEVGGGWTSSQAGELGDELAMASLFVGTERRWWHDHFGNGLLTRRTAESVQRLPLPSTGGKGFRNAMLLVVRCGDQPVTILATHLDARTDRDRQLDQVCDLFESLAAPAVLMGDFNARTDHPRLRELLAKAEITDAVTTAAGPQATAGRIDHIFVKGLNATAAAVVENAASDHPFVWAELTVE